MNVNLSDWPPHNFMMDYFTIGVSMGIKQGFEPFKPGSVDIFMEYDIDFVRDRILIEFPSIEFYVKVEVDNSVLLGDPRVAYDQLEHDIFTAIRYRAGVETEPNIVLGEN